MKTFSTDGGPAFASQAWHMKRWADCINNARDMTDCTYAINLIMKEILSVVNIHQRKEKAVQSKS